MMRPPDALDPNHPRRLAALRDCLTKLACMFPQALSSPGAIDGVARMWSEILSPWTAEQILAACPNVQRERRKMGMIQPSEIDEWLNKHAPSTPGGGSRDKEPRWMEDFERRKADYRRRYTDEQLLEMNRVMKPFESMDPALEVVIGEADARRQDQPERALPPEMVSDLIAKFREDLAKKSRKRLATPSPKSVL